MDQLDQIKAQLPAAGAVDPIEEDLPPSGSGSSTVKHEDTRRLYYEAAEDMAANRVLREKYAGKAYDLSAGCISFWVVAVSAQGIMKALTGVELFSDSIIIAITTGVTVNVLAAFLGVIRGLFPNGNKEKEK
jgi:hypothetical protein